MKARTVHLEITEGQALAILEALPGSGYSGCVALMRKIDKQLNEQTNDNFKAVRRFLSTSDKEKINVLNDIYERMN